MEKGPNYPVLPQYDSYPMPSAPPDYNESVQQQPMPTAAAPAAAPPAAPAPPSVIVVTQSAPAQPMIVSSSLGPASQPINCPKCKQNVYTKVEMGSTCKTHICAIFLCLFLCWPCICCPYCTDCCRVKKHYCPSCGKHLGNY